jgi:hypothetical protein
MGKSKEQLAKQYCDMKQDQALRKFSEHELFIMRFAFMAGFDANKQPEVTDDIVDTDKCEKCGSRTALVSGQWYHEMDSEPYMSGKKINDEDWIHGFKCDDCGHLQGIWDEG